VSVAAADIMRAELGTTFDGLFKVRAGWAVDIDSEPDIAAAKASGNTRAYSDALRSHPHVHATLTADRGGVRSDGWCTCTVEPDAETWVRYERWETGGRAAHGYVCPRCRFIVQSG